MKKARKIFIIPIVLVLAAAAVFGCYRFTASHTFKLSDEPAADSSLSLKSERIQPVFGSVRVWSTQDTEVWFTDEKDPDKIFKIGYVTPGMSETVRLERGHWYIVHGEGEITVRTVNVCIE